MAGDFRIQPCGWIYGCGARRSAALLRNSWGLADLRVSDLRRRGVRQVLRESALAVGRAREVLCHTAIFVSTLTVGILFSTRVDGSLRER